MTQPDPHAHQPVAYTGAPLETAKAAMIMLHGRGASPEDILPLGDALHIPHVAFIAPAAAGGAWYPQPFIAPREQNEPWLSSALGMLDSLVIGLLDHGFDPGEYSCSASRRAPVSRASSRFVIHVPTAGCSP